MLPVLALGLALWLQAGVSPKAPAPVTEIVGRITNTRLFVRMDVPGFTRDDRTAKILQQALGTRGVLIGAIPEKFAVLEVIVDKETDKHISDAEWRDLNLQGSGNTWKYFESAGMSCGEVAILIEGSGTHDYHAFAVRGGYRIDISLSESLSDKRAAGVPREFFERLVGSFRLGLVRLGTWSQMPAAALDLMDAALRRSSDWKPWIDEQEKAKPEEYSIPFARAELLRFYGSRPEEQLPSYLRAIELLAAKKECTPPERLAHAASEDGLALALLESGEAEKVVPHIEAALKIAQNLTAPVRAVLLYDQARAQTRLGHGDLAVELLKRSESEDPGALDHARIDKDFDPIRQSSGFQELLRGDRSNR